MSNVVLAWLICVISSLMEWWVVFSLCFGFWWLGKILVPRRLTSQSDTDTRIHPSPPAIISCCNNHIIDMYDMTWLVLSTNEKGASGQLAHTSKNVCMKWKNTFEINRKKKRSLFIMLRTILTPSIRKNIHQTTEQHNTASQLLILILS